MIPTFSYRSLIPTRVSPQTPTPPPRSVYLLVLPSLLRIRHSLLPIHHPLHALILAPSPALWLRLGSSRPSSSPHIYGKSSTLPRKMSSQLVPRPSFAPFPHCSHSASTIFATLIIALPHLSFELTHIALERRTVGDSVMCGGRTRGRMRIRKHNRVEDIVIAIVCGHREATVIAFAGAGGCWV